MGSSSETPVSSFMWSDLLCVFTQKERRVFIVVPPPPLQHCCSPFKHRAMSIRSTPTTTKASAEQDDGQKASLCALLDDAVTSQLTTSALVAKIRMLLEDEP